MKLTLNVLLATLVIGMLAGCAAQPGDVETVDDSDSAGEVGTASSALDLSQGELSCQPQQDACYARCGSANPDCISRCDDLCPDPQGATCYYKAQTSQCFVYGCIGQVCEWTEYSTASGAPWTKCSCWSLCDVKC